MESTDKIHYGDLNLPKDLPWWFSIIYDNLFGPYPLEIVEVTPDRKVYQDFSDALHLTIYQSDSLVQVSIKSLRENRDVFVAKRISYNSHWQIDDYFSHYHQ